MDNGPKVINAAQVRRLIKNKLGYEKVKSIMINEIPSTRLGTQIVAKEEDVINYFKNYFIDEVKYV